jgi:hypothetical protein
MKGWFPKEAPHATEDVGPSSQPTEDVGPSPSTPPRQKKVVRKLTPRKKNGVV